MNSKHRTSFSRNVEFALTPLRVDIFTPPIRWKGDPVGHMGGTDTFYYVVEGECYVMIDGESYIVKPGQLMYLPKGKMRIYSTLSDNLVMYEIGFRFLIDGVDWYTALNMSHSNYVVDIENREQMVAWFESSMLHELQKNSAFYLTRCSNMANIISAYVAIREKMENRMVYFRDVTNYMNENIHQSLSIEALAEVACMQPTYFIRRFKAAFGSTPIVHFNKLKIYKAMTLLSSTDHSLQKIAAEVGVGDAAYFSRMFKKHCDISPTEYRRMFAPKRKEY